jgi:penicillin-binding protein 1B
LLCVVWVGFDDGRELNLEGAHSALPVWAEFMKRAAGFREYRDAKQFPQPSGIVSVRICADSGQLAGEYCPNVRSDVFIDGTQPAVECQLHSLGPRDYADRLADPDSLATAPAMPPSGANSASATTSTIRRTYAPLPPDTTSTTVRRTVAPAPSIVPPTTGRPALPPPATTPTTGRRSTPPALPPPPPVKQVPPGGRQ